MSFFIQRITRAFVGRRSRVRLQAGQWRELLEELHRRAGGFREAGAFLLSRKDRGSRTIERIVYFDDIDPACLTGGISMCSAAFSKLWRICRAEGLRVVADVHTHPHESVAQSGIDRANPMVATPGHVAIIVPHLAARGVRPEDCGVHVYRGDHAWTATFGRQAARLLYVGRWA